MHRTTGHTPTEQQLALLCDKAFHKLWTYPSPRKEDGKELCDLLVVFEGRSIIFFDRENRKLEGDFGSSETNWKRWKRDTIDRQVKTAAGAERYLRSGRKVYLDPQCTQELPVEIDREGQIHKVVVAHGAKDACERASSENVSGSLAISYGPAGRKIDIPFFIEIDRSNPVHIFDSNSLGVIFENLDTIHDFSSYLEEKERAIAHYPVVTYCGEEDLLAHYLSNFRDKKYRIGVPDPDIDFILIGEGEWRSFEQSTPYLERQRANSISFVWDELINQASNQVSEGPFATGDKRFIRHGALKYMAREPRLSRRALSERVVHAIDAFPKSVSGPVRLASFMSSYFPKQAYVLLQVASFGMNEADLSEIRSAMLEIACAALRNFLPNLERVVGIAMGAPRFHPASSVDFGVLDCVEWPDAVAQRYRAENEHFGFFRAGPSAFSTQSSSDFPSQGSVSKKIGRNSPCPCGSRRKFKHCCMRG